MLIRAVPGDTIQLTEGTYRLSLELMVTQDHITIRGKGPDKTVLSFKNQDKGSKGLEATGDCFVIEDLAVEDTVGNAIKVLGANGVTFRRVRTEWTGGPKPANGAYGIYPVQCENVLIDECVAIGASDAGIYVGQSQNVIVRNCRAERNVAGIEIENTINADVYGNVATGNTGGILVFDLPGLDERARAWLDVNCAHCHSPSGLARTSGLDLRFEQDDLAKVGLWKTPIAAGRGSGGRKYDVVPGKPDQSILLFRLESSELGIMMPELPRRLVHDEGVALIREWVRQLREPETCR